MSRPSKRRLKPFQVVVAMSITAVLSVHAAESRPTSLYTNLSGGRCETVTEDKKTGSSIRRCPGVEGFRLLVAEDDDRVSVGVVSPDGKEHPLDYWNVVTRSFSSLGKKAEWRVVRDRGKVTPIALIVRVDAQEQDNLVAPKKKSYLVVAKIGPEEICVTDKIGPSPNANEQARQAADIAANQACLKP
jgi:hypothetical protein